MANQESHDIHNEQTRVNPNTDNMATQINGKLKNGENIEMDREQDSWMMNEFGSMHLLDDSNHFILEEEQSTVPIDRGWAWMTVVGCFGMHILAIGGIKSFGVLFVELEHRFDTTSKSLAAIQSVATTLLMGMCPISNALSARFGCRRIVFIGGILTGLGFITSSVVPSYQWLFLTYGVIGGLGFGLSYAPCIVFVGHHFSKYRALANGLSLSGSGVGTFIFPACIHFFNQWYGLPGSLLIIAGMMFNICVCAALFRPLSNYKTITKKTKTLKPLAKERSSNDQNIENRDEEMLMENFKIDAERNDENINVKGKLIEQECVDCQEHNGEDYKCKVEVHKRVLSLRNNAALRGSSTDIMTASLQTLPGVETPKHSLKCCCCGSSKTNSTSYYDFSMLSDPVFLVFLISCTITNFAYPNVFIMIPSYGEEIGMDQKSGALLISIIGISDLVGRIFFGWLSDRKLLPRKYEFMGTMGLSGMLSLILPFVKSRTSLFVYCGLYGFFSGSYICLIAVVLIDTLGVEKLSAAFGLTGFGMTLGLLAGPTLVGALRDASGSWDSSFICVGMFALVASAVILLEPLAQRRKAKKSQTKHQKLHKLEK